MSGEVPVLFPSILLPNFKGLILYEKDTQYLVNFQDIVSFYQLDKYPSDLESAIIRFLFLNPVPPEIYKFLPARITHWRTLEEDYGLPAYVAQERSLNKMNINLSNTDLTILQDAFPSSAGRAGKKTLVDLSSILRLHRLLHPYASLILQEILTSLRIEPEGDERICKDWSDVTLASLLLFPFASPTAHEEFQALFPLAVLKLPLLKYAKFERCSHYH
jgi:hypothetical protein